MDQGGTPGDVLSCASLREAKISKDTRPTSITQLAVPASLALSPSLRGVLFITSKHHVRPCVLSQHGFCLSKVLRNAAKLRNVRRTDTCPLLAKNPSSRVLSCACFSRTSSLLCLLQLNVPSRVCLSLSPVSTSRKHSFTYLPQQNTTQHN